MSIPSSVLLYYAAVVVVVIVVDVWLIVVAQLYILDVDAAVVVVCGTRNFAAKLLVSVSAFSPLDGPRRLLDGRPH